ncbi:Protein CBG05650 [Caenorhabditis briggsae]|uniref:Uncharacterized protein n=2 Tax=Caenorhabditis briggsae TaxID=6238 RepID=A0AAE9FA32_CAEBR|nr:Protein CBG05650 [Caenorhabditis briggsae]ULT92803.1 hypothetical protein L3Y34_010118 [Caenorhabditis briggsae]UMM38546.1 hypothetical protein L5515_009918 [Caenorhabditis briggsae]CAP26087.1 Protein CBG05650 [Caenorhabditis briggsae]
MSDASAEKEKKPLGKLKFDLPQVKYSYNWQKRFYTFKREEIVEKVISIFAVREEHRQNRRFRELEWFAKKMELILFDKSETQEIYEDAINAVRQAIENVVSKDAELQKNIDNKVIPPTEMLEKLFTLKADREEYVEEDFMEEGATVVHLITPDRFRLTTFDLKANNETIILKSECERKPVQGQHNRRIAKARYTTTMIPPDELTMEFTLTPLDVKVTQTDFVVKKSEKNKEKQEEKEEVIGQEEQVEDEKSGE